MTTSHAPTTPSAWAQIRLVAGRELRERARSRSFRVSTIITLLIVAAIVALPAVLGDDGSPSWDVAVIGEAPPGFAETADAVAAAQDAELEITVLPSTTDPQTALDGVDAVLVDGRVVTEDEISSGLRGVLDVAWVRSEVTAGLADAGLDPEEAAAALDVDALRFGTLDDGVAGEVDSDAGAREAAAFIGVIALFIAINSYGAWVLGGVLEEKSSRVVEIVVAALPPRSLLAGKVLGIGALGLGQLAVMAVVGLAVAVGLDAVDVPLALVPAVASVLVWFVLGFAFYAVGYAAAGSLVSRQDDAQSAASPLTMTVLASYFVTLVLVTPDPEGTAAVICSLVPFTAPLAMPSRIAQGAAAPWEIAASIAIMVVSTWGMVRTAARIYERSLLRTGPPIRLTAAIREVVRGEHAATGLEVR